MAFIKLDDALHVCSEAEEWYIEINEQHCAVVADDIYQQIANIPTADVVEVVRCKDCIWFVPEHIKRSDGTTRPYTDEEKKLPCGVTSDIGINVGSYCLRKGRAGQVYGWNNSIGI